MQARLSCCSLIALLAACDAPTAPLDASVGDDASTPAAWRFETLREERATVLDLERRVELVRATRPDGQRTYLLYVHASAPEAPLVVVQQPYAGIDWSGEDVDARWAAGGDGLRADVDAPAYDGDDVIAYTAQPVAEAASDCGAWLFNGFACVHVYARFYAGGTLVDDAIDASAAYHFALARDDELDLARIGAFGGSWGGLMALQGAARAPEGARPRAVAAMAPPSDFVDLAAWSDADLPAMHPRPADVAAFYSPYWRRASPDIGRPPVATDPRAALFTHDALCDALTADVLLVHDEWDVLVPFRQSEALTSACPERVRGVWWRRQAPTDFDDIGLDHGAFAREPVFPSYLSFAMAHLASSLTVEGAPWTAVLHRPALEAFLTTVLEAQRAGDDVRFAAPALSLLCDSRGRLFDPEAGTLTAAPEVIALAINATWGTTLDAAAVCASLASGLPPAP